VGTLHHTTTTTTTTTITCRTRRGDHCTVGRVFEGEEDLIEALLKGGVESRRGGEGRGQEGLELLQELPEVRGTTKEDHQWTASSRACVLELLFSDHHYSPALLDGRQAV